MAKWINKTRLMVGALSLATLTLSTGCHMFDKKSGTAALPELDPESVPHPPRYAASGNTFQRGLHTVFIAIPGFLWDHFNGSTPLDVAKKMQDPDFPDERRRGIADMASHDYGRRMPYTERYQQMAQLDPDWLVRKTAIRALNYSRDESAKAIYRSALTDENSAIRLEGAKALANVPDEQSIPSLMRMVSNTNEDKDVRVAAAMALAQYRRLDVGRTLVGVLQDRDFAVSWQARQSLMYLTQKDHRYDEGAWLELLTSDAKPLG